MQTFKNLQGKLLQRYGNLILPYLKYDSFNNRIGRPSSNLSVAKLNINLRPTCSVSKASPVFNDASKRFMSLASLPKLDQQLRKNATSSCPLMDLCGKTAIVTGAANGIGYCITQNLICNGVKVLMVDIDEVNGCKAAACLGEQYGKSSIDFYNGDITCAEHRKGFFKRCIDCFGQVNIVVNAATVWDENYWTKEIEIGFKCVMDSMLLSFKHLTSEPGKKGGLIVNLSSTFALKPFGVAPIYSATKRAVLGLTRCYSDQFYYNKYNIRMCTLCPGVTCTPFLDKARNNMPSKDHQEELDRLLAYEYKQSPDVVGAATVYLTRYAPHGSTWVLENSELYMIDFPHYRSCCLPSTMRVICDN